MKKLLSVLLAICMAVGVGASGTVGAKATDELNGNLWLALNGYTYVMASPDYGMHVAFISMHNVLYAATVGPPERIPGD